ncbi:transposase [Candidatus Regiella insecticola LSR1]|uniref:Transposase n=1 Tax=Candidatus Regiella insecticola LSR1 TaxID=663321 RepID=E0WRH9_9ENTR|nr:transposase [Candidatus Regiella insecticola LSR1]
MSILKQLALIPDPRKDINIKHQLIDVIFLVFATVVKWSLGMEINQSMALIKTASPAAIALLTLSMH